MTHSQVTIYIPTAKVDTPDVRDTLATLRWIIGGMTRAHSVGSWFDENHQLIEEPITTLTFITEHHSPKVTTFMSVLNRLVEILKASGEESVLITSANTVASFK